MRKKNEQKMNGAGPRKISTFHLLLFEEENQRGRRHRAGNAEGEVSPREEERGAWGGAERSQKREKDNRIARSRKNSNCRSGGARGEGIITFVGDPCIEGEPINKGGTGQNWKDC